MTVVIITAVVLALFCLALSRMQRGYFFYIPLKPGAAFDPKAKIEGVAFINYDERTNLLRVHCYQGVKEADAVKRLVEKGIVREDAKVTY